MAEKEFQSDAVASGIIKAEAWESGSNILSLEILLIAIGVGVGMKSWWAFGLALVALFVVMLIPYLGTAFLVFLSAIWGLMGYQIGKLFDSVGASVVLGLFAFLCALGVHSNGRKWFNAKD